MKQKTPKPLKAAALKAERQLIDDTLALCGGSKTKAARILGITTETLRVKRKSRKPLPV